MIRDDLMEDYQMWMCICNKKNKHCDYCNARDEYIKRMKEAEKIIGEVK